MSDEYDQLTISNDVADRKQTLEQSRISRGIVNWDITSRRKCFCCWWLIRNVEVAAKLREPVIGIIFARIVKSYCRVAIVV